MSKQTNLSARNLALQNSHQQQQQLLLLQNNYTHTHQTIAPAPMNSNGSGAGAAGGSSGAGGVGANKKRKKAIKDEGGAGEDGEGSVDGKAKKGFSCQECHRRKQKCDRKQPCNHCVSRKVPDRCHPFTPGKPEDELLPRLLRLEKILSIHYPQYNLADSLGPDFPLPPNFPFAASSSSKGKGRENGSRGGRASGAAAGGQGSYGSEEEEDEELREEEERDLGRGRLTKGKWFGVSAVGSMSEAPILERLQADNATIELHLEDISSPAENLQRLITECGVSPTKVAELVQELPPKDFANTLVDWFFSKINFTRYPIHEGMFRAYEALYANGLRTDPANVRCLPLVFIILATAVRLAPEHIGGDDRTRRLTSLRYYWSSRRSILIATAIQSESLELVVTRLLSSRYLIMVHDRRLTECWSQLGASLRTAQAIGLHRDGTKLGLDAFQTEYRRRIWSYLYHADRTYSLILGRPPAISDAYTDTLPPSNLEDSELVPGITPEPRPLTQPTTMTYGVLRHSLSRIIGKITHHFQQLVEPSHYADVLKLDDELNAFVRSLPPHYRMENPDRTLDGVLAAFLPMHRFFLITEILFVRITLHRPWLLRKLKSDRFLVSRNACFESAKRDFGIRQAFKKESHTDVAAIVGGQFREFNAAMIAGISAIIEPHGEDAPEMRGILATFLHDHPQEQMIDDTTKKERSIIETLYTRSTQLTNASHKDSGVHDLVPVDPSTESHAQTLLGLAASSATSPQANGQQPLPTNSVPSPSDLANYQNRSSFYGQNQSAASSSSGMATSPHWAHLLPAGQANGSAASQGGRMASTPPSLEDESAQALLDQWCQENLALDTVTGASEQIFPPSALNQPLLSTSNFSWPASNDLGSSFGGLGGGVPMASVGMGLGGLPSSGLGMGGGSGGGAGAAAGQQGPGDFNYWEGLINSILAQGGDAPAGATGSGSNGVSHRTSPLAGDMGKMEME